MANVPAPMTKDEPNSQPILSGGQMGRLVSSAVDLNAVVQIVHASKLLSALGVAQNFL